MRPWWVVVRVVTAYRARQPSDSVLYQVVQAHVEMFRAEAAQMRDGAGLPRFVHEEFDAFLRCGWLSGGFARLKCGDCREERLVAFSCKGRGFCASCGARRMSERAAHLVDHVLPDVPIRQWVLTLPPALRYLLAWRHDLCRDVVGRLMRAITRHDVGWAGRCHLTSDPMMAEVPTLAGQASVQHLVATGARAGRRPLGGGSTGELGRPRHDDAPCQARWEGFDLQAALRVPAGARDRLERVCRYVRRPPITEDRLALEPGGLVRVTLRHPWADGTTHVTFEPTALLARLAVVPRPRINLLLYHGVLAPRAAWRPRIVPASPRARPDGAGEGTAPTPAGRGYRWAALMARVFAIDVLACPRCGGRFRLVALLEASAVTERILAHLGQPTTVPAPRPARAPPTDAWAA